MPHEPGHPYTFDPEGGDTGAGDAALPSYPKNRVVSSFAHLQALIPDYEGRSFNDILASSLFTGPDAYQLDPNFVKDLYSSLLQIEAGTGVSIGDFASQVPAGVIGSKSAFNRLLDATDGGGGGAGGGGRGPIVTGAAAPDPYEAAAILALKYDKLVQAETLTADDAAAAWQREFDEMIAERETEIADRNIATERFAAEQRLQDTATQRGELEFDMLRSSLPAGMTLNLGPFGRAPQQTVNIQDVLTQGLPPLAEQYANIGSTLTPLSPLPGLPGVAPLELPDASLLDPLPGLADQAAAGFRGFIT